MSKSYCSNLDLYKSNKNHFSHLLQQRKHVNDFLLFRTQELSLSVLSLRELADEIEKHLPSGRYVNCAISGEDCLIVLGTIDKLKLL